MGGGGGMSQSKKCLGREIAHRDQGFPSNYDLNTNTCRESVPTHNRAFQQRDPDILSPTILARAFPSLVKKQKRERKKKTTIFNMKRAFVLALLPILAVAAPLQLGKLRNSTRRIILAAGQPLTACTFTEQPSDVQSMVKMPRDGTNSNEADSGWAVAVST